MMHHLYSFTVSVLCLIVAIIKAGCCPSGLHFLGAHHGILSAHAGLSLSFLGVRWTIISRVASNDNNVAVKCVQLDWLSALGNSGCR